MKKILFILFYLTAFSGFSQSKMVWLNTADKCFEKKDYYNALIYYQKVVDDTIALKSDILPYEVQLANRTLSKKIKGDRKVTLEEYTHHQIAMCHQLTYDYKRAETQFEKTYQSKGYPNDAFYYGSALKNNEKYSKAIDILEAYVRSNPSSDSLVELAIASIQGCNFILNDAKAKTEAIVRLADTSVFNKGTSSFAVSYFGGYNRLMFTSARPGGVILKPEQQSEYLCDVYWTEKDEHGKWKSATNFGRPMNSAQHDAASTVNNTNTIFYTRWSDDNKKEQSIYLARMFDFKFFEAYKLDERVNVAGYSSIQPNITLDGKTLYFSSNRPGGYGGMDIWKIELDTLGNIVGEAENLGPKINSNADEITPFFHDATSTLFYSSNGFNSIGGFDVFKSDYDAEKHTFSIPANMGTPINSSYDDTYLIFDSKLDKGFLSSDREPCEFGHCYNIYEISNSEIVVSLEGNSYVKGTEKILPNTTVTIKDVKGVANNYNLVTDENGYYKVNITIGEEIFLKAQKEGYFADAGVINTESITESMVLRQDFYLDKIPEREIRIDGIEYDFDSDKLRPESKEKLDIIAKFLELNDNLVVEINSHTDYRGSDKYNLNLSKRRAQSCVNYLIENGIDKNRLIPRGYGESDPTIYIDEDRKPILDSEGHEIILTEKYILTLSPDEQERTNQLNRRTAFKVVGENFQLESSK
ncbi:MAG: OmpA family protein [Crocinitomicaceae bacterium]|nr:OmpA family protein [Crocinitomicaceae bacterium]